MEPILVKHIYDCVESDILLNEDQYGFRPDKSPEDQLILIYHPVTSWLNQGLNVELILFFVSQKLSACHTFLEKKLFRLDIKGKLLYWIKEFLITKSMNVVVINQHSHSREVLS